MKDTKIFLKKKKTRGEKKARERYQNFAEKEKEKRCHHYHKRNQKLPEYRRNYHLTHKKQLLDLFIDFLGPGTIYKILKYKTFL